MKKTLKAALALGTTAALLAFAPVSKAADVFFGETLGSGEGTRLATFANATNARNAFLSNLTGVGTESFESYANFTGAPLAISFAGAGTATLTGTGNVDSTLAGQTNGFGRYATDGSKYWESGSSFGITFSTAVAAFGFMGVDIGDFSGQLTVTTMNGVNTVYNVGNTVNGQGGGVLFWGVIDTTNLISSISFGNTASGTDFFAFDQMTIGSVEQVTSIPEPETYALLLAGLGILGFAARRRQRQATA